jgi:hypothetical protein
LDSMFIVAEYRTKLVKKRLSHNIRASMLLAPLLSVLLLLVHGLATASHKESVVSFLHFHNVTLCTTCLDCITRVRCGLWNADCQLQDKPQDIRDATRDTISWCMMAMLRYIFDADALLCVSRSFHE